MNDDKKQEVSGDAFEDGLRHILSHQPVDATGQSVSAPRQGPPDAAPGAVKPVPGLAEAAERLEKERKMLFWFNLLRPIAVVVLLLLLLLFAHRMFGIGLN